MKALRELLMESLAPLGLGVYEEGDVPPGTPRPHLTFTLRSVSPGTAEAGVSWHGEGDSYIAAVWLTDLRMIFPRQGTLLKNSRVSCLASPRGYRIERDAADPRMRTATLALEVRLLGEKDAA